MPRHSADHVVPPLLGASGESSCACSPLTSFCSAWRVGCEIGTGLGGDLGRRVVVRPNLVRV